MDISGGTLTIDDKAYQLAQLHFHTPSEHTIDGTRYPAEVHLVHAADDGQLAVVGVMFEEGDENAALAEFWNNIPNIEEAGTVNFNAGSLLPDDRTAYTYSGSLTTPPCSEVVSWHVMETPVSISADQLETLTNMHDDNERPIQPLNDRTVEVAQL
jgi:carbonic anhydrase